MAKLLPQDRSLVVRVLAWLHARNPASSEVESIELALARVASPDEFAAIRRESLAGMVGPIEDDEIEQLHDTIDLLDKRRQAGESSLQPLCILLLKIEVVLLKAKAGVVGGIAR